MSRGFRGSVMALLAGAGLVVAQPPATLEQPRALEPPPVAAVRPPLDPGLPPPESPRSPYWPNPLGFLECTGPGCAAPAGAGCAHANDAPQGDLFWASADYLLWWVKKGPLATPLVTTSSPGSLGVLGTGDTSVVYGRSDLDYKAFSGARFSAGSWFDRGCSFGLEGSGFFLEKRPADFAAASSTAGTPVLARPIFDVVAGREAAVIVAAPGGAPGVNSLAGTVAVSSNSGLYGWDLNLVDRVVGSGPWHVDVLAGFRYLHLDEDLDVVQNSIVLPGGGAFFAGSQVGMGTGLALFDHFSAVNDFYGGQLGSRVEYAGEHWFVSALGKVALGSSHEVVNIAGASTLVTPGAAPTTVAGGVLAVSSNSGRFTHDEFAAVPEVGVNVGWQANRLLRVYVGYSFLYWSEVARPGDQVSRTVNPGLIPTSSQFGTAGGPAQPSASFARTDFWAQGVNFGLEFRY